MSNNRFVFYILPFLIHYDMQRNLRILYLEIGLLRFSDVNFFLETIKGHLIEIRG